MSEPAKEDDPKREEISISPQESEQKASKVATQASQKTAAQTPPAKPKEPLIKRIQTKTGLDVATLVGMLKSALPPTIGIAMYQADAVANFYSTTGYLIAISSVMGFAPLPRAKWLQTIFFNIVAICFSSAINLLSLYCATQARLHTTPAGLPLLGYNSSASAVCAVFLFVQVYFVASIRSARPQLQFPAIVYSIFVNVSLTYGPFFPTMDVAMAFIKRLLITFLTGFGLAAGVSLLVFPVNCRLPVFKIMDAYLRAARAVLRAQESYIKGLQNENYFGEADAKADAVAGDSKSKKHGPQSIPQSRQADALKRAVDALVAMHAKLAQEMPFGKREIAYGKLRPSDFSVLLKLFRGLTMPLLGVTTIMNILERLASAAEWNKLKRHYSKEFGAQHPELAEAGRSWADFQAAIRTMNEPLSDIRLHMDEAIQHVVYTLQFQKRPKTETTAKDDVEAKGEDPKPGDEGFTDWYEQKLAKFYDSRKITIREWCHQQGMDLPPDTLDKTYSNLGEINFPENDWNLENKQIFIILHVEYLMWSAGTAMLEMARFADSKVADGTMKKNRIIVPGRKRLFKWFKKALSEEDGANEDHRIMDDGAAYDVALGDAFQKRHDPEHLKPTTFLEKMSDKLRIIPRILRTESSSFGFRTAAATLSIGIVDYLHSSAQFFNQQRLVWAMIMVAFSMQRTTGQSVTQFAFRVAGTAIAMVASFVIWYIVDGKTAGVLVFLFIWIFCAFYIVIKKPQFAILGVMSTVTTLLIIGYELQVRKIGVKAATATGQPYYPIYELAPYRLLAVTGGLAVAYFWTVFPYPITESSEIRRNTGGILYLLANYYSIVHETIAGRVRGDIQLNAPKGSPGALLEKSRVAVFAKSHLLLEQLKLSTELSKMQITVGGRFPRETYNAMIFSCERALAYISLMSYASITFTPEAKTEEPHSEIGTVKGAVDLESTGKWLEDFKHLLLGTETTSHDITSCLALLSSSITSGNPLPPYLKPPTPHKLLAKMQAMDSDILDATHMAEPGYAAFAVLHVSSRCLSKEIEELIGHVKNLVGELDFSFHFVSTTDSASRSDSQSNASSKNADDNEKEKTT